MENPLKTNKITIENQLQRIFSSSVFVNAVKQKNFLKYIVEETLDGREKNIKAYTIATEVYGRKTSFDPQQEPIIRIEAGRLRRRLNLYYSTEGKDDPIFIDVPKGRYVPRFEEKFDGKGDGDDSLTVSPGDRKALDRDACIALIGDKAGATESALGFTEPIIAVLPFSNLSGDKTPNFLMDGISDELSSSLALFDDIRVIDYYSMAKYREQPSGIREIGQKLEIDFLLTGSIKTTKDSITIRTSLSETKNAVQIWTNVFNKSLSGKNLTDTLSEIVGLIVSSVAGDFAVVFRERMVEVQKRASANFNHYEAMFKHRHAQLTGNWEYSPQIKESLENAVEKDPGYAMGWALLSEMYLDSYAHQYTDSGEALEQGYASARNAVQQDRQCQYAHFVLAYAQILRRDPGNAIKAVEKVWNLNPNAAYLVGASSFWACIAGDFERGLANLNRSILLNPNYPGWFHHAAFSFHLKQGNYPEAQAEAENFYMPEFFWSYLDKTVAAGLLGRADEANALLNKVIELHPDFVNHPRYYVSSFVMDEDIIRKMMKGLKISGL